MRGRRREPAECGRDGTLHASRDRSCWNSSDLGLLPALPLLIEDGERPAQTDQIHQPAADEAEPGVARQRFLHDRGYAWNPGHHHRSHRRNSSAAQAADTPASRSAATQSLAVRPAHIARSAPHDRRDQDREHIAVDDPPRQARRDRTLASRLAAPASGNATNTRPVSARSPPAPGTFPRRAAAGGARARRDAALRGPRRRRSPRRRTPARSPRRRARARDRGTAPTKRRRHTPAASRPSVESRDQLPSAARTDRVAHGGDAGDKCEQKVHESPDSVSR